MKKLITRTFDFALKLTTIILFIFSGCKPLEGYYKDKTVGTNGSFEYSKNGLPVNWILYTQKRTEIGDYDILIDTTEFKDGKQSLKFAVRECSNRGGRFSLGFIKEYFETKTGGTYKVSFWIKNNGSEFSFRISAVSDPAYKGPIKPMELKSKETIDKWRLYEYNFTLPPKTWLMFDMNILQPGTFWIDDIKVEKI